MTLLCYTKKLVFSLRVSCHELHPKIDMRNTCRAGRGVAKMPTFKLTTVISDENPAYATRVYWFKQISKNGLQPLS